MLPVMGDPKAAPDRELLLANHAFPGEYIIKAFGPSGAPFETAVQRCAHEVLDPDRVASHTKVSSGGRRICVTLTLNASSVDEVIQTYENLYQLPDLLLIL